MKLRIWLLMLCLAGIASAAPTPQQQLAALARLQVNAQAYQIACDGSTDDYQHFANAVAAVPSGGWLFIPPQSNTCLLSQDLVPTVPMTIFAYPGTVTLKAKTGNTSNPVLLAISGVNNVTVQGVVFDGGGTSFTNTNTVVTVFNSSNTLLTQVTVQNTRGIGVLLSNVAATGVTYSIFNNIGMYWQTSLSASDRHQAISFCCTGTLTPKKNFAVGNYFTSIGLDAVSATSQTDFLADGNRCQLSTAQTAQAFGNWPACVYGQGNTAMTVVNTISDSAPGNGIDIAATTTNLMVGNNYVIGSGGAGISIDGVSNFSITGNVLLNNVQNGTDCHTGGITFGDSNSIGTISGNVATDTQGGSKTQTYGIYSFTGCSHSATLTNVLIDAFSNNWNGNKTGQFGGGLAGPTAPFSAFTVATLPSCTSALSGAPGYRVSDATAPTYNATLTGGGAVNVPVYCNGSAWTSH